jgi:hypothetical protein
MVHECSYCDYETNVDLQLEEHVTEVHQPMSRDAFIQVLNAAADRVIEEMSWESTREQDAINLVVNVLGEMLDHPDATVEQVMEANYSGGADEVRSWWPRLGLPNEVRLGSPHGREFTRAELTQSTRRPFARSMARKD